MRGWALAQMAALEPFVGQRLEGTVSSFKANWGWVSCPEIGADLFAHEEDLVLGALCKGAQVSFEVGVDVRSGKPRARQIEVHSAGAAAPSLVHGPAEALNGLGAAAEAAAEPSGPRTEGVVTSWKEAWGWVSCALEEKDVFAHREDIVGGDPHAPLEAGVPLTFELGVDPKSG